MVRILNLYSHSNFQIFNSVTNYGHCAIHYLPRTYSFYNQKFVPFDQNLPISLGPQPLAATIPLCFHEFDVLESMYQ